MQLPKAFLGNFAPHFASHPIGGRDQVTLGPRTPPAPLWHPGFGSEGLRPEDFSTSDVRNPIWRLWPKLLHELVGLDLTLDQYAYTRNLQYKII